MIYIAPPPIHSESQARGVIFGYITGLVIVAVIFAIERFSSGCSGWEERMQNNYDEWQAGAAERHRAALQKLKDEE